MKTKLLKKLRRESETKVELNSKSKTNGVFSGRSYSYSNNLYRGLGFIEDDKDFFNAVFSIFLKDNINIIRIKYKKYSIKNKK